MALYIDGFVLPVPSKNFKAYKKLATLGAKVWIEHGALDYVECAIEDAKPGFGLPFLELTKCKKGETVMFSFIVYRSRAHRDQVNKRVMADKRMGALCNEKMPFDLKRMACGGFKSIVSRSAARAS